MPIQFGEYSDNIAFWVYIPNEDLILTPYLDISILCIRPGEVKNIIIPSLRMFERLSLLTIRYEIVDILEYPQSLHSISYEYTCIKDISNIPKNIKHLTLTNNEHLTFSIFPPNLISFEGYGQRFGRIVVNATLIQLSLFRCSFSYIEGITVNTIALYRILHLLYNVCPYPNYVALDQNPNNSYLPIPPIQYLNIISLINREIHIRRVYPFVEIRERALRHICTPEDNTTIMQAFRSGSNYARRITDFISIDT